MPWLLTSPGYHHPWYWLCRIGKYLPFLRKGFNYVCYVSVEKWHKFQIYFVLARKGLVKYNPKKYAKSLHFVVLRCDLLMVGYIHILQGCYPGQSVQDCCIAIVNHYDVIKWKHFPRYWPLVQGIHRSPVNSPHKGQWRGALIFSLICVWKNGWVNNGEAGDLRRYRAHYDVTVMALDILQSCNKPSIDMVLQKLSEWLTASAIDTEDYAIHISRVIITYILESLTLLT